MEEPSSFAAAIAVWKDFYNLTGTAAATLIGLLFVAVSLDVDRVFGPAAVEARAQAAQAFANFLYVLLISLVFLVPEPDPLGFGGTLTVMGVAALGQRGQRWLGAAGRGRRSRGVWRRLAAEAAPAVADYLVLVAVGLRLIAGDTEWLHLLVPVVLVLLAVAGTSAWGILATGRTAPR
jgi:hypothetical protein